METLRWKVKPRMDMTSTPSVKEVYLGDGYSQRASARLSASLKTYSMMLSVSYGEAMALESSLTKRGDWKAFLWAPPCGYRQIRVVYIRRSPRVNMLCVKFSAEFEQVMN